MSNKTEAQKRYCKVKPIFKQYFPNGATLKEACRKYKDLYPNEDRDIASVICGQKNQGNFKIVDERDGQAVYQLYTPTKLEKLLIKRSAAQLRVESSLKTLKIMDAKLEEFKKKNKISPNDWDLDINNYAL